MLDLHSLTEMDFQFTRRDLLMYAVEAKDNVRFLSTLERHFKNIKYGAKFQVGRLLEYNILWMSHCNGGFVVCILDDSLQKLLFFTVY